MFGANYNGGVGHIVDQGTGVPWSGLIRRMAGGSKIHNIRMQSAGKARRIIADTSQDPFGRKSRLDRLRKSTQRQVNRLYGKSVMSMSRPIGRERDFRSRAYNPKARVL